MSGKPTNQALAPNRDKFGFAMLGCDDKQSMSKVSAQIGVFLVSLLFLSPICRGQDKLDAFFDPDEANAHRNEVAEALKLICPDGLMLKNQQGIVTGCQECPQGTAEQNSEGLSWDLRRVFTGHFTSANEENILLSGVGCESHSNNFGGTFMFAIEHSRVRLLHYDEGLTTERCRKFQVRNAPDMLVCVNDWGAQVTLWSYIHQVKFDDNGESEVTHIFETIDLSLQKCGINFYDDTPTFIQQSHITGMSLTNPVGEPLTLSVTATFGKKNPTEKERKACEQGEPISLPLTSYKLKFMFNGSTFEPLSESKETLKLFPKSESPKSSYSPNPTH
jgi:hypothetical protein